MQLNKLEYNENTIHQICLELMLRSSSVNNLGLMRG